MSSEEYKGVLEIDHDRGVIYFHSAANGQTLLRICSLPTKIPRGAVIDVSHMVGVSYGPEDAMQTEWSDRVENSPEYVKYEYEMDMERDRAEARRSGKEVQPYRHGTKMSPVDGEDGYFCVPCWNRGDVLGFHPYKTPLCDFKPRGAFDPR